MNKEYAVLLTKYGVKDGVYALAFYLIYLSLTFFQGYLFTTSLSVNLLTASQLIISILQLVLCVTFVLLLKNRLSTIGITTKNILFSLTLGLLGAVLLLMFQFVLNLLQGHATLSLQRVTSVTFLIFTVGAVTEEVIFRGYIQTRLSGLLKNRAITSCITAILFLLIHYPAKWIVSGAVSIWILSGFHIVCLLLLHFLCDLVYKSTNCLWGSIILHFLYNTIGAMLIYSK